MSTSNLGSENCTNNCFWSQKDNFILFQLSIHFLLDFHDFEKNVQLVEPSGAK
jgi:hypothetical protein